MSWKDLFDCVFCLEKEEVKTDEPKTPEKEEVISEPKSSKKNEDITPKEIEKTKFIERSRRRRRHYTEKRQSIDGIEYTLYFS